MQVIGLGNGRVVVPFAMSGAECKKLLEEVVVEILESLFEEVGALVARVGSDGRERHAEVCRLGSKV